MKLLEILKLLAIVLLFPFPLLASGDNENDKNPELTIFQNQYDEYDFYIQDEKYDDAIRVMNSVVELGKDLDLIVAYSNLAEANLLKKNYSKSNFFLNKVKSITENTSSTLDDAYYFHIKGKLFYRKDQNEEAIRNLYESLKIFKQFKNQELMIAYNYYYLTNIQSRIRIYSDDYKKYAEENLKYALKTKNTQLILLTYNEQCLFYETAYNKLSKEESLDKLFKNLESLFKLLEENRSKNIISNRLYVISYNNAATFINNYPYKDMSQMKRSQLAEEYLKKGIDLALKNTANQDLLAYCYITYGEIYNSLWNDKETENYYLKAYNIIQNNPSTSMLYVRRLISTYLSNFYFRAGKYDQAYKFKEEELKYSKESYEQLLDDKKKYLEAYYGAEQQTQQIKQLEESNKLYAKQRFLYIGIAMLAIFGIVGIYYMYIYKQRLSKEERNVLEAQKIETELKLQLEREEKARLKVEQELLSYRQEQLEKQALATSLQLNHKNNFITELKERIKDRKDLNLDRILKDERLTDNDFNEIQKIVQDVHPNFFKRLGDVSKSKLSNQDLKYAAYIYLNMDNQQIANLLKVESKTVRMTKYRLKQKIGLDKEQDLQQFIQNLVI